MFPLVKMNAKLKMISIVFFSVLVIFTFSVNVNLLGLKKSDYPQFKFAKTISKKENATLLNYGFLDAGFYTTTKIVPNCRFFCSFNIPNSKIMEEQNRYIKEALIDFVVTVDEKLESENYELLQSVRSEIRKSGGEFFLYKKKERPLNTE